MTEAAVNIADEKLRKKEGYLRCTAEKEKGRRKLSEMDSRDITWSCFSVAAKLLWNPSRSPYPIIPKTTFQKCVKFAERNAGCTNSHSTGAEADPRVF